uniref:Uncharacterized protein n=1 Tax=Avena sativa TaxID=4498 RepID=A0ACD5WEB4_AVESA
MDSMSHERLVCILMEKQIRLLDPATGAFSVLPDHTPLDEVEDASNFFCTIGRLASTGEHKVLTLTTAPMMSISDVVCCKILTLSGRDRDDGWRETGSPPLKVMVTRLCIAGFPVLNGVAYILGYVESTTAAHEMIMEFDLDCEAWRPASLRPPRNRSCHSLAELQGHLVAAYDYHNSPLELWFLVDSEHSIWSKRYTITMPHHHDTLYRDQYFQKPLAVLDDGRVVTWMRVIRQSWYDVDRTFLRIYDPRTNTSTDGTTIPCNGDHVTVFTWSLLHSGQRGALDRVARIALISRRHPIDLEKHHAKDAQQETSNKVI